MSRPDRKNSSVVYPNVSLPRDLVDEYKKHGAQLPPMSEACADGMRAALAGIGVTPPAKPVPGRTANAVKQAAVRRVARQTAPALPTVPEDIVRAAMAEPSLKGRVFLCSKRREPLLFDGKVVGFVTPHETKDGWRHGPIFVLPEYRGKKLVQAYYASHPERRCVAFVPHENKASRRLHDEAGFKVWKGHKDGAFMRREPIAEGEHGA